MQITVGYGDALVSAEIAGDGSIARCVAIHVGQERVAKAMNSREQLDGALLGRKGFPYPVGRHAVAFLREKQRLVGGLRPSSQQIARYMREDKGGHIDFLLERVHTNESTIIANNINPAKMTSSLS